MKRFAIIFALGAGFVVVCYAGIFGAIYGMAVLRWQHETGHSVKDLPVYPGAEQVQYSADGPAKCSILKFVTDHLPEDVQTYYLNALGGPDKGWYGDGSHYPEFNPVTTHHEDHGPRLTAYLKFLPYEKQTQVEIKICRNE